MKERRFALKITSHEKLADQLFPGEYGSLDSKRKKIAKWENGYAEPSASEFRRLCNVLECDPEYLWGNINTPRRNTQTVMEATNLSQKAVETLTSATTTGTETPGCFKPGHIIDTILENPDFYRIIFDIMQSVRYMTLEKRNSIRNQFIKPGCQSDYQSEISKIEEIIHRSRELSEEYGYTVVEIDEMIKVLEFRINQNMGKLVNETITLLHEESQKFMEQLLEGVQQNETRTSGE